MSFRKIFNRSTGYTMIDHKIYAFRNPDTGKYPWYCCPKCGCYEIGGFIGKMKILFKLHDHKCVNRSYKGYSENDWKYYIKEK